MEHSPWKSYDKHVQFQYPTLLSNTVPCSVQSCGFDTSLVAATVLATGELAKPRLQPHLTLQAITAHPSRAIESVSPIIYYC